MKVAGLTGGIASGKSTVASMFSKLGVHIIDADEIAKEVVKRGNPAFDLVIEGFGREILTQEGEIDRKKLGKIVFFSKEKREKLNQIVHPFVKERMLLKVQELGKDIDKLMLDIPLLFESGTHQWLRPVILVYVPERIQIQRLSERDGLSYEEALARIRSQMSIEEKRKLADYIIDNTGALRDTEKQVKEVYVKVFDAD